MPLHGPDNTTHFGGILGTGLVGADHPYDNRPPPKDPGDGSHWVWDAFTGRWVLEPPPDPPLPSGPPSPAIVNQVAASSVQLAALGTDLPIVYGAQRVPGGVVYQQLGSPSVYVIVFCSGPVNAVTNILLNGVVVPSGTDGVNYTVYLGGYSQSVNATILSNVGNYRLPGVCYAVLTIQGGDSFTPPSPWYGTVTSFSADIKGCEVYDPRENRITRSEDFSNSYWSSTPAFPTLVTGVTDRFGGTTASRWTFGGSGPYVISHVTSGLSLVSGDPVTVVIDVRTTSGTVACNLTSAKTAGGASTSEAIVITTSWRRRKVTLVSGGTGNAQIQLDGIPSGAVIEVAFSSVQILADDYGYTKTVASAVTAGTRYSVAPPLAVRDLLTDSVHGAGLSTSFVNDAWFGRAAAECDAIRADGTATYQIGLVIRQKGTLATYIEAVRGICAGDLFLDEGKYCFWVDALQPTDPVIAFDDRTNAKAIKPGLASGFDRPTRVVVEFYDAAKSFAKSTVTVDHPSLASSTIELKEARYQYDGITSEACANRVAEYTVNVARVCELTTTFTCPFVGVRLYRGMKISLTTTSGLAAQLLLVLAFTRLDTGEYQVTAREYDEALYTFSTLTADSPVASNLPAITDSPPPVRAIGLSAGGTLPLTGNGLFFHPPIFYKSTVQYGSSYWSGSGGVTGFDAAKVNDGNTGTVAVTFTTAAGGKVTFDAGVGVTKRFVKARIYLSGFDQSAGFPTIAYGDSGGVTTGSDGVWWVCPAGPNDTCSTEYVDFETGSGYIDLEWSDVGDHRYWAIFKPDTSAGSFTINEIQFYEQDSLYPIGWIAGYEIRNGSSVDSPLVFFWPGGKPPYNSNGWMGYVHGSSLLNVDPWVAQTPGSGPTQLSLTLTVVVRNIVGKRSTGRTITRSGATTTPTSFPALMARTATGGTPQTANANIDGTFETGTLAADPQDADTVPVAINNVSAPNVSLLTLAINGSAVSDIDKRGSLRTDESARICPWVEDTVTGSDTTISSTSYTDISSASITFTPPSDCRIFVVITFDITMTTSGSVFVGALDVNGTDGRMLVYCKPSTTSERATQSQAMTVQLTGGTSYTLKLKAKLASGSGQFTVTGASTGFTFVAVGIF